MREAFTSTQKCGGLFPSPPHRVSFSLTRLPAITAQQCVARNCPETVVNSILVRVSDTDRPASSLRTCRWRIKGMYKPNNEYLYLCIKWSYSICLPNASRSPNTVDPGERRNMGPWRQAPWFAMTMVLRFNVAYIFICI